MSINELFMDEPTWNIFNWLSTAVVPVAVWIGALQTKVNRNKEDIKTVLTKLDTHAEQREQMALRQERIETKVDQILYISKNGSQPRP